MCHTIDRYILPQGSDNAGLVHGEFGNGKFDFLLVEDKFFFPGCTHIGTRVHHIRYARKHAYMYARAGLNRRYDSSLCMHGRRSVMNEAMQYIEDRTWTLDESPSLFVTVVFLVQRK